MADPNTTPQDRIRIFSAEGHPLTEFRATVERSWAIAEEGRASFTYATRKTTVVNENNLQFGNWLLVQSTALPAWIGVIDTPRNWTTRSVEVCAYTPEHLFTQRRGPLEEIYTGSAGSVFERLLRLVNAAESTILRTGSIWRGGEQLEETINPTQLSEDLKRIQERSGEEYQFRPFVADNGQLIIYCDWMDQLGIDTEAMLHEGKEGGNVEMLDNILVEDGPIWNDVLAYGDGETWKSKANVRVRNPASIGKYSLRQTSQEYSGVTNVKTLQTNGTKFINDFKQPARAFKLNALNVGRTWNFTKLGNRMNLQFQNIGFYLGRAGYRTRIRITGMAYDPTERNKLVLTIEEVTDPIVLANREIV